MSSGTDAGNQRWRKQALAECVLEHDAMLDINREIRHPNVYALAKTLHGTKVLPAAVRAFAAFPIASG